MSRPVRHPLLAPAIVAEIERAASEHLGRPWLSQGFTSLDERSSHPCGIFRGQPFSVFAKLSTAREQFTAELAGLRLLGEQVIDAFPYFGPPGIDLAQVDIFQPAPADLFDAYRDVMPIAPGFADRRELWRIPTYLAVITVDGNQPFGRRHLARLADAIRRYR